MYTIREYNVEDGNLKDVTHVWFMVKSLEESENLILKRIFKTMHGVWCIKHDYAGESWDRDNLTLWKITDTCYDLDYNVGPETIRRYIITTE